MSLWQRWKNRSKHVNYRRMEVQSIQSPQQCSVPSFTGSALLFFGYIVFFGVPRGVRLTILKVTIPDPSHFRQMLKISPKTWSASQRVLENHCSDMLGDLIRKADIAQSAIVARSRVRTRSTKGTPYTPSRLGRDLSTHTPKARRINAAAHLLTHPNLPKWMLKKVRTKHRMTLLSSGLPDCLGNNFIVVPGISKSPQLRP